MSPAHSPFHQAMTSWWTPALRRQTGFAAVASVLAPLSLGVLAKLGVQPGLHDDALRQQQLIDYMVLGGMLFCFTMLLTWLIGCWIVAVMKGRTVLGDEFPAESHRPSAQDDRLPPRHG